jgi:hypothetical protein
MNLAPVIFFSQSSRHGGIMQFFLFPYPATAATHVRNSARVNLLMDCTSSRVRSDALVGAHHSAGGGLYHQYRATAEGIRGHEYQNKIEENDIRRLRMIIICLSSYS